MALSGRTTCRVIEHVDYFHNSQSRHRRVTVDSSIEPSHSTYAGRRQRRHGRQSQHRRGGAIGRQRYQLGGVAVEPQTAAAGATAAAATVTSTTAAVGTAAVHGVASRILSGMAAAVAAVAVAAVAATGRFAVGRDEVGIATHEGAGSYPSR